VLASFNAVSDAVYCAKAIQKACENEPDLKLRIGIHEGEVVFEDNDVFGDGVNIASRLEPLAPIGGISVSESVNRNLGNKKGIETIFVGEKTLKNIKDPIKVYQVKVAEETLKPETSTDSSSRQIEPSGRNLSAKKKIILGATLIILLLLGYIFYNNNFSKGQPVEYASKQEVIERSIAVIPFKTITEDSTSRYIAEGVREAILNNLFKIKELQVGSRTSAETYRNSTKRIPEIASELGVATILEGSAQKFGDQIRITVQLIDGKTDNHLWSEEYDRDWGDIFAIYTEIAEKVAAALQVVITPEEKQQITTTLTTNVTAYDYILQAREEQWKHWDGDTAALGKAEILFDKVLKLDPQYARGWAKKGEIYWDRYASTLDYFEKNYLDSVLWFANKAIALDPETGFSYFLKGMVFHKTGNIDLAIKNYEKALVSSQYDPQTLWETGWRLGYIYIFQKDVQKGMSLITEAVKEARGSPRDYRHMISRLGGAYMFIGAYEEAENYFLNAIELGNNCTRHGLLDAIQGNFQTSVDRLSSCCQTEPSNFCSRNLAEGYFQLKEFETSI
jgi:adenylate cyclase